MMDGDSRRLYDSGIIHKVMMKSIWKPWMSQLLLAYLALQRVNKGLLTLGQMKKDSRGPGTQYSRYRRHRYGKFKDSQHQVEHVSHIQSPHQAINEIQI